MRDWRGLRLELAKDRAKLLQFFCAATSYRPMRHMVSAHLGGLTLPEWDAKKGIWTSAKTNKLELGGIGAGKTAVGGAELTMGAIANPGGWHLMTGPLFFNSWS